jgi:hypothetical protein
MMPHRGASIEAIRLDVAAVERSDEHAPERGEHLAIATLAWLPWSTFAQTTMEARLRFKLQQRALVHGHLHKKMLGA